MPVTVVLGAQWGDEGKGKLADILAQKSTLCCRAAGGNNAGHTIIADNVTYDFHILPSGLASPNCKVNLIGAGCVVHIPSFFKEIEALEAKGLANIRDRILISDRAHICFDLHVALDGIAEDATAKAQGGKNNIGTTRKGIGPCYSDKVARLGVNFWMLAGEGDRWEARLRSLERAARKLHGGEALAHYNLEDEVSRVKTYREKLAPFIVDQVPLLASASGSKAASAPSDGFVSWQKSPEHNILIEGANAILLDVDHGTYPFVTSSSTGLGGVFTGLAGFSPFDFAAPGSEIVGVVKAYTTRVGSGPFPTELDPAANPNLPASEAAYGEALQRIGREFGVTTGRKRRCGWLDLMTVKYSTAINRYTAINLTKLDILDTFEEIRVATSYSLDGVELESFPADLDVMARMEVTYKTFKGWKSTTTGVKDFNSLPPAAKEYVQFIEGEVGVPIKWIGTGPGREDMIFR